MQDFNIKNINSIDDTHIGIYFIRNKINQKCYIGQSITLKKRLINHIKYSSIASKRDKYPLYLAINKYGLNNFEFKILFFEIKNNEDISNQRNKLNKLENDYIQKYDSYGNSGYNQTFGSNSKNGAGTFGYKYTNEQKRNLSEIQKTIARDKYDPYFVYEIDSKKCFEFYNSFIFKEYANITEDITIRRANNNQSGFSIYKDKYIIAKAKSDLKDQLIKYIEFKKSDKSLSGQFQKTIQNIYLFNYILNSYYTFYCISDVARTLNKKDTSIHEIITRECRTDDGWIISKNKNRLEELRREKEPSDKVKLRYNILNVNIKTYPYLSIKITKNEI